MEVVFYNCCLLFVFTGCGGTLTAANGTFTSPGYPSNSTATTRTCSYLIQVDCFSHSLFTSADEITSHIVMVLWRICTIDYFSHLLIIMAHKLFMASGSSFFLQNFNTGYFLPTKDFSETSI